jgi:NAD dependent epimerase/dehydratase family enzyme
MVGSAVVPYLASQGHEVTRLVRRQASEGEVRWDPDAGSIDAAGLEGLDGVVNVATMPWPMRWNDEAKKKMIANRMSTNGLLARTLAACKRKPQVLVCASGMGIYPSSAINGSPKKTQPVQFPGKLQCEGEQSPCRSVTPVSGSLICVFPCTGWGNAQRAWANLSSSIGSG